MTIKVKKNMNNSIVNSGFIIRLNENAITVPYKMSVNSTLKSF